MDNDEIEIYFNDLTTRKQHEILKASGAKNVDELVWENNWDIVPVATIPINDIDFEETEF